MNADAPANGMPPPGVRRPDARAFLALGAMLIPLAGLVWFWNTSPEGVSAAERVTQLLDSLRSSPFSVVYVAVVYALLSLAFVPITALIAATALLFEPLRAFLYALTGSLLSAAAAWAIGRFAGSHAWRFLEGPRLAKLRDRLHAHAFRATIVARLLPVGNFTAINLFAGTLRVPLLPFLGGNTIGMSFGIGGLTLLADRASAAWNDPTPANVAWVAGYVVALVAITVGLSKVFERRTRK